MLDQSPLIADAERTIQATDTTIAHSRESLDDTRAIIAESKRAIEATRCRLRPEGISEALDGSHAIRSAGRYLR